MSVICTAFGSASAMAQSVPACAALTKNSTDSVAASKQVKKGGSVSCHTLFGRCPRAASFCDVTLSGAVGYPPAVGVGRAVVGQFETTNHFEAGFNGSDGNVIDRDACTVNAQLGADTCTAKTSTRVLGVGDFEGVCTATAGAWTNPLLDAFNYAASITINYCQLSVTAVDEGCRARASSELLNSRALALGAAARRSCKVKKRRVRLLKNPPLSHPIEPPPPHPPPDYCTSDDPNSPPVAGCRRVTVRVIPAPLPSDPENESIGVGVGSATVEPGGQSVHCLNAENAEACVITVDVPANESVTVSAQPGSLAGDPASPPDSAFYKFAGACAGAGTCKFTPSSGGSAVDVYFIPAMATLTLQATGDEAANMTANEFAGGGLEPIGPVYCGSSYPANPLPCKVMVRVEKTAQVEANSGGDESVQLLGFSSNCTPSTQGPSFCDILMTADQTVTAEFGGLGGL